MGTNEKNDESKKAVRSISTKELSKLIKDGNVAVGDIFRIRANFSMFGLLSNLSEEIVYYADKNVVRTMVYSIMGENVCNESVLEHKYRTNGYMIPIESHERGLKEYHKLLLDYETGVRK